MKVKLGKWPDAAPILPALEVTINDEGFKLLDLTLTQAKRASLWTWSIATHLIACWRPGHLILIFQS